METTFGKITSDGRDRDFVAGRNEKSLGAYGSNLLYSLGIVHE
jgi:hypothetical protein